MDRSLKNLHDRLLAEKPNGAVHDSAGCPLCADGGMSMTTYTEDEMAGAVKAAVDTAVAQATAEYRSKVAELEAAQQSIEVQEAVATAVAEYQAKLEAAEADKTAVAAQLDEAVLAAEAQKQWADQLVAWLEGEAAAAAERITVETRRDSRVAAVKEVACFPDAYLEANADRFAAMSDEDFAVRLEELKVIAAAKGAAPGSNNGIPAHTALHASRDDTNAPTSTVAGFMAQRRTGQRVDYSSLY